MTVGLLLVLQNKMDSSTTAVILSIDCQDFHSRLNDLRQNSSLCDVCIVDDSGASMMAHSCILATGSPILKDMLLLKQTVNMMRKNGLSIKIKGVTCEIWDKILQYFYFGKLNLCVPCHYLDDLYKAAKMLRIESLLQSLVAYATQFGSDLKTNDTIESINVTLAPTNDAEKSVKAVQVNMYSNIEEEDMEEHASVYDEVNGESNGETEALSSQSLSTNKFEPPNTSAAIDSTEITTELSEQGDTTKEETSMESVKIGQNIKENMVDVEMAKDVSINTSTEGQVVSYIVQGDGVVDDPSDNNSTLLEVQSVSIDDNTVNVESVTPSRVVRNKSSPKRTLLSCPNLDCNKTYESSKHKFYVEHLLECVMAEGCIQPIHHVQEINGYLIYDDGLGVSENDVKLTATVTKSGGNRKTYQCTDCKLTGNLDKMANHLAVVHGKRKPYSCKVCNACYGYIGSFLDHYISAHTSTTHVCPECNLQFRKKDSLRRHILMVHKRKGQETHMCNGCGKRFKYSQHARRHEKYHLDSIDRPFACRQCEKKFVTKQELERHFDTHTGEKAYTCSRCNFTCARKSNLILHERKHGLVYGEFVCTTCDKYFISESRFKSHIEQKKHSGGHLSEFVYQDVDMDESFQSTEVVHTAVHINATVE